LLIMPQLFCCCWTSTVFIERSCPTIPWHDVAEQRYYWRRMDFVPVILNLDLTCQFCWQQSRWERVWFVPPLLPTNTCIWWSWHAISTHA
jgi:hypothetical protein